MDNSIPLRITMPFVHDPFGMLLVGRNWEGGSEYRYGFNGKESDKETYGDGNIYDYGFRIYNPRLGRFMSVDPLTHFYAELTPYQFASNSPIFAIDLDGLEANANLGGGRSNPVLNPTLPIIEYQYNTPISVTKRFLFIKYTIYQYSRTKHYYNVPLNEKGAKDAYRNNGKEEAISKHEWENGKQWQYIGPFQNRTSTTSVAASPSININENGSTSDAVFSKTFALTGPSTSASFSGMFYPSGAGAGSSTGVTDQIVITNSAGAVIFSTGFASTPVAITIPNTTTSINITVTPNAAEVRATGIVAGDADNWDLTGTLAAPATVTATTTPSPNFNSSKARLSGDLRKYLQLKRVSSE